MSGYRGGWSNTLTTENTLKEPGDQQSLSEELASGVLGAHRQNVGKESDMRNFRRSIPVQQATVKGR